MTTTTPHPGLFGRLQVPETPETLKLLHVHDFSTPLKEVEHPPKVAVLDQEDLLAQGIDTSQIVPGAQKVDALGTCTAQATMAKLSSFLTPVQFAELITQLTGINEDTFGSNVFADAVTVEKAAIVFYHRETWQTGDPSQEWPPIDCGSAGPY